MREQFDEVSLKKKQYLRLSMLNVGENRLFVHEMISFRCHRMSYLKLSCMSLFSSRLVYVVLKNKKQQYPDDDIELVQL